MIGESDDVVKHREEEIERLFLALDATHFRNITQEKSRRKLAIALYYAGYRIPSDKFCAVALNVVLERIRKKGVYVSLNSPGASSFVKARSEKGIFISFEELEDLERWLRWL